MNNSMSEREHKIKFLFASLALMSLLCGVGLYLFGGRLGLDPDTSRLIATSFIVAGTLDALVLYCWEWLFSTPSGRQ